MSQISLFCFSPRDPEEGHRSATSLELIFDLASVIAIAGAAHGLAHAIESGHIFEGVIGFFGSFFMIWLAWMNYTWFASAYDDDSSTFRLLTMVIMMGALMLAAGISAVFALQPIWLALLGFIVMRLGMAVCWLSAARGDPARRRTALHYAAGILVLQIYWIAMVTLIPPTSALYLPLFLVGVVGELSVPAIAERCGATTWHREHMIERYGLLNIIVLAETFVAITAMIQLEAGTVFPNAGFLWLAVLSAAIAFSLWGIYFTEDEHLADAELPHALLWGYGHFVLFAAGAATGAGMSVMLAVLNHSAHIDHQTGVLAIAIPVTIYLTTLWVIRDRLCLSGGARWLLLAVAALVLALGALAPAGVELIAALLILAAVTRRRLANG